MPFLYGVLQLKNKRVMQKLRTDRRGEFQTTAQDKISFGSGKEAFIVSKFIVMEQIIKSQPKELFALGTK
jgi:hypothetical protein